MASGYCSRHWDLLDSRERLPSAFHTLYLNNQKIQKKNPNPRIKIKSGTKIFFESKIENMKPAIARVKRTTRDHEMHPDTTRTRYHHYTQAKFIFAALFLKAEARGVSQKEFLSDMKAIGYSMTNQP